MLLHLLLLEVSQFLFGQWRFHIIEVVFLTQVLLLHLVGVDLGQEVAVELRLLNPRQQNVRLTDQLLLGLCVSEQWRRGKVGVVVDFRRDLLLFSGDSLRVVHFLDVCGYVVRYHAPLFAVT